MERNKIFILLKFVNINSKIIIINIIEFENIAANKKIIGMLPKRFITNNAQCSPFKFKKLISVGVVGSTPYWNAVA